MQTMTHVQTLENQVARNEFNKKIAREAKAVFDAANEDDLTSFYSEVTVKCKIRNELQTMYLTDEMVQALYMTENTLDDAFKFYLKSDMHDQIHLVMFDYIEQAEYNYIANMIFDKVKAEYDVFYEEVKKSPRDSIIEEAFKIAPMYDLYISLSPERKLFSVEQLKALLTLEKPLWELYDEWLGRDSTYMDDMRGIIEDVANEQVPDLDCFDDNELDVGLEP